MTSHTSLDHETSIIPRSWALSRNNDKNTNRADVTASLKENPKPKLNCRRASNLLDALYSTRLFAHKNVGQPQKLAKYHATDVYDMRAASGKTATIVIQAARL